MRRRKQVGAAEPGHGLAEAGDSVAGLLTAFGTRLTTIEQAVQEVRQQLAHQAVEKDYYTTTDLAAAMGVSVYTVTERWCNRGRIECEKDPDTNRWRIPGHEFQRLVRGGTRKAKTK
jgi:hypothetical protein